MMNSYAYIQSITKHHKLPGSVAQLAEREAYTFCMHQISARLWVRLPPLPLTDAPSVLYNTKVNTKDNDTD